MADVGIRDYLKGRGYKDDEITYNNGNVMLKGKNFYGATPQADGSTYGDANKLNQAFNNYNMNDAIDSFKSSIGKPRAQFAFDPNSDQAYQSALGAAQRSAATAGNNASVRLGSRGIGNSQQALTTENQIQQRSVADVNSNILPQLINQAYNRFHDQQVMDDNNNDKYLALAQQLQGIGQQDLDNEYRTGQAEQQKKQSNWDAYLQSVGLTGDLGTGPKEDYGLLGDRSGNLSMAGQGYKDDMTQRGVENTRADKQLDNDTRQTNASIANMNADNVRQAAATAKANGDDEMALRFKIWENTGLAPDGIPGVPKNTKLAGKSSSAKPTPISAKVSADNYIAIKSDLESPDITKAEAIQLVQSNVDELSDSDYRAAMEYIEKNL